MPLFKYVKKNKLSEYFSAPFWDSHFFCLKREVFSELALKSFKTTDKHSLAVCGSFWGEKQLFVPLYCLEQTGCLQQIQIFLWMCTFSNLLRKTNFLSISELHSEIATFWTKKWSFQWFSQKNASKIIVKHSLAVCWSLWGEKQFLLIFVPFYWFDQKQLFKQIQIFLRICPFWNC